MNTKVKIISFSPLTIYSGSDGSDLYSTLSWSIRAGYPRVSVFLKNSRVKDIPFSYDNLIIAPFDIVTINTLLTMADKVIAEDKVSECSIKCYNTKFVDNVKTDEVTIQAEVVVGKSDLGVVYIMLKDTNKSEVRFELLPNLKWHKFYNADKAITDPKTLSGEYSKSYFKVLRDLINKYTADETIISKYKDLPSTVMAPKVTNETSIKIGDLDIPY